MPVIVLVRGEIAVVDIEADIRQRLQVDVLVGRLVTLVDHQLPGSVQERPIPQVPVAVHREVEDLVAVEEGVQDGGAVWNRRGYWRGFGAVVVSREL